MVFITSSAQKASTGKICRTQTNHQMTNATQGNPPVSTTSSLLTPEETLTIHDCIRDLVAQQNVRDALALCCDEFDKEIDCALLAIGCSDSSILRQDEELLHYAPMPDCYRTFFDLPESPYLPSDFSDYSDFSDEEMELDTDEHIDLAPKQINTKLSLPSIECESSPEIDIPAASFDEPKV